MNEQNLNENVWTAMFKPLTPLSVTTTGRHPQKKCKGPRLHQLEYDIRDICQRNAEGPAATKIDRKRALLLCAKQLFQKGVRRKRANNLNAGHIRILVEAWHAERLTAATIRNRLHYLRWLARKIGKPQMVAPANCAYGAGRDDK